MLQSSSSGGASSATNVVASSTYSLPSGWEWVLNVIDDAHLPHLGLPVRWDITKEKHAKVAFNPITGETIDIDTGRRSKNPNAVGFITATKNKNPMPGATAPASVRYERFMGPCLQDALVKDATGSTLVPCIAHGDYVKVESLESDHLQAKEGIIKRQIELVAKLNAEPEFAKFILEQQGMDKFFIEYNDEYYGSLLFYELYFNDIDNIWLICDACNSHKSNEDTLDWLSNQWMYGEEFLDYLTRQHLKDDGILTKTNNKEGLAKVAIEWFWDRHANYVSIARKLYQDVVVPIQILNMRVDRVAGQGNLERTERLQASLMTKVMLAKGILDAKVGMPKGPDESPHDSSDDGARLSPVLDDEGRPLPIDAGMYAETREAVLSRIPEQVSEMVREELRQRAVKRAKNNPTSREQQDKPSPF